MNLKSRGERLQMEGNNKTGFLDKVSPDGEIVETVSDFILGGSKITADGDCSHEIKRHLLTPWKEIYDQPR